jgi:type VI secretion system (T6SS) phospholipase Tle1-like effector
MKRFFAAVCIVAVVALGLIAVWLLWTNYGTQVGLMAGLGLGVFVGPARLSGVDFRQWFRNPESPSEIEDDTYIGLVRSGCNLLWASGLAALVGLSFTACHWAHYACTPFGASALRWLGDILLGTGMVGVGALVGVAAVHAAVEASWRAGLVFLLPPPSRLDTDEYLSTRPLPYLRQKQTVEGYRRLIICCDGTWNWPAPQRETNVVRLVRSIVPEATVNGTKVAQIVHYHQGVGTGNFIDRLVGGGVGIGLSASVKACYGFLVDNYRPGDEIFLFGFSRGAYVVRSLSGMIGAVGLLRKQDMARFAEAWNWYWQDRADRDEDVLDGVAPKRHRGVEIECIGVFDTVGALGIPGSRLCRDAFAFHETQLGAHVRNAFQALAIDERRGNFQAAIWVPADFPDSDANRLAHGPQQVLKQMWFPGVHSNVGGGYESHGLSDTAFLWMLLQVAGKLQFEQDTVVSCLDTKTNENFPRGTLEDSRTRFWKFIGSPIPRPVCIVSATEYIHQSAQLRATGGGQRDTYDHAARRRWVDAMAEERPGMPNPKLILPRETFESTAGGVARPAPAAPREIRKKLDVCSWLVSLVSARS